MRDIAKARAADRAALFRETSAAMGGVLPVIIEKDFWVCWALDHLFSDFPHRLIFKGGTSLSKAFGLMSHLARDRGNGHLGTCTTSTCLRFKT